jgi:hypothetical protein
MKEEAVTDALLRQFLLGTVEDEERQRIESLFLTDPGTKERLFAAEQELIDEYVEDCLSAEDRERFLSQYADTPAQRRKLRIAKSIKEWAANQPKTAPVVPEPAIPIWGRLFDWLRVKFSLVIPIAVTAAIVIVIAVVWMNSRRSERQRQHFAIEQELAQLNTPSSFSGVPPATPPLTLKPGSIRSADSQPELTIRRDSPFSEVRLLWMPQEDYPTYKAAVRLPGDDQSYTIPNLKPENDGGKVIPVRLPTHMLKRGTYQIELSGVSAGGSTSPAEIYSFTVSE